MAQQTITKRPDWDSYFMAMLSHIAARSTDPNTHTGCLIAGPNHEIRTTGYNGFPRGANDSIPERLERPEKYFWIEHAERNAVYNAARVGIPLDGCTLYVSWMPCMDCARAVMQSGIKRIVVDRAQHAKNWSERWQADFDRVTVLLAEVGVDLQWWERNQ